MICISMYTRDLEELDAKVAELKQRGWTKANKSQLIRLALSADRRDEATDPAPVVLVHVYVLVSRARARTRSHPSGVS